MFAFAGAHLSTKGPGRDVIVSEREWWGVGGNKEQGESMRMPSNRDNKGHFTRIRAVGALFLATIAIFGIATAELTPGLGREAGPAEALTREKKSAIVDRVCAEFRAKYVFPDVAERMAAFVESKLRKGEYDPIVDVGGFTSQVTEDLRSISHDKHIKVLPGKHLPLPDDGEALRREHFGFDTVEVLTGNIGYLEFFQFYSVKDAGPTAIAALNFLSGCDALIIDLRGNGGGYPALRQLMCSYFFDDPTCLIEFRGRNGKVVQDWTLPYVPGPKMVKIPVYILVSRLTFSCAEDFAFAMQCRGRATIIGEATGGGAHDCEMDYFPEEAVSIQVPFNEAVDPVTKKTWEGVGVQPDIKVPSGQALQTAVVEATKTLLKAAPAGERKFLLEWVRDDYAVQLKPVELDPQVAAEYVGTYGPSAVSFEYGQLYYSTGTAKRRLIPVGVDDFKPAPATRTDFSKLRIRFVRDAAGKIVELSAHDCDGGTYPPKKRT